MHDPREKFLRYAYPKWIRQEAEVNGMRIFEEVVSRIATARELSKRFVPQNYIDDVARLSRAASLMLDVRQADAAFYEGKIDIIELEEDGDEYIQRAVEKFFSQVRDDEFWNFYVSSLLCDEDDFHFRVEEAIQEHLLKKCLPEALRSTSFMTQFDKSIVKWESELYTYVDLAVWSRFKS